MSKDEFYIGYSEKAPSGIARFVKSKVWLLAMVCIAVVVAFAFGQKQFSGSTFELGKLTWVEGTLHPHPYPVLRVQLSHSEYRDVLLLGFGKFGAMEGLKEMAEGHTLKGLRLKLQGTLIYYDGVTLMQLEPEVEGTYEFLDLTEEQLEYSSLGETKLQGEIIDPKCYFGVMKPGYGKIHRSCAVRCISGGIPPVFMTTNSEGVSNYYLITAADGRPANEIVLDHIGKPCTIEGELQQVGGWMHIRTKRDKIQELGTNSAVY